MSEPYTTALDRLGRVPGVRETVLVDARAGVPVLGEGAGSAALAALAAAVYRRAARASEGARFGELVSLQLEADRGYVVIAGTGETIVVAVADRDAQLGLVRLEARRAAEGLA